MIQMEGRAGWLRRKEGKMYGSEGKKEGREEGRKGGRKGGRTEGSRPMCKKGVLDSARWIHIR